MSSISAQGSHASNYSLGVLKKKSFPEDFVQNSLTWQYSRTKYVFTIYVRQATVIICPSISKWQTTELWYYKFVIHSEKHGFLISYFVLVFHYKVSLQQSTIYNYCFCHKKMNVLPVAGDVLQKFLQIHNITINI